MTWSEIILKERNAITEEELDLCKPEDEVPQEFHIAGVASEDLKKDFVLALKYSERLAKAREDLSELKDVGCEGSIEEAKIKALEHQVASVKTMFLDNLCSEHKLWSNRLAPLGICKGWQVVWGPHSGASGAIFYPDILQSGV